jgi:BMFP domain-containing protein YqiC
MNINKIAETIASKAAKFGPADEIKESVKALVRSQLSKLDMVSREEFDTQQAILLRTREKVDALEAIVKELQTSIDKT